MTKIWKCFDHFPTTVTCVTTSTYMVPMPRGTWGSVPNGGKTDYVFTLSDPSVDPFIRLSHSSILDILSKTLAQVANCLKSLHPFTLVPEAFFYSLLAN